MQTRKMMVFVMLVLALVLGTAVVHAITIVVDGIEEAVWTSGSGSQLPGVANDPNESGIANEADIELMRYTNDQEYFYLLLKTYGSPTRWSTVVLTRLDICMDTDNDPATGGTYANCPGMTGIDRTIRVQPYFSLNTFQTELQFVVYNGIFVNPIAGGNSEGPSVDVATQGDITEIRLALASLGLNSSAACDGTVNMNIYFDGGDTDPDDNLPDSGSFQANCGSPTAVSLQSFTSASNNLPTVGLVGMLALVIVSFGLLIVRRERRA